MSVSFSVVVLNEGGLHARPCGVLVKYIVLNGLDVLLSHDEHGVNADSLLDVMSLCIPKGSEVSIQVAQDEHGMCGTLPIEEVVQDIKDMFTNRFGWKV